MAADRGYPLNLVMPESMSLERRKILKVFGANLILTPASKGMRGAVEKARQMVEQNPEKYLMLDQFSNPANPAVHEETTGPEIWADTGGKVDVLVSGVGTGGTITGVSRYLKKKRKSLVSVAVEPEESPIIGQKLRARISSPARTPFRASARASSPRTLDLKILDRVETVSGPDAIAFARRLCREEGILSGISCGAAVAVCDRPQPRKAVRGQNHRRHPSGFRRTLPFFRPLRRPGLKKKAPLPAGSAFRSPVLCLEPEILQLLYERRHGF